MFDLSHLRLKTIDGVDGQKGGKYDCTQAATAGWAKMEARPSSEYPPVPSSTNWKYSKTNRPNISSQISATTNKTAWSLEAEQLAKATKCTPAFATKNGSESPASRKSSIWN
jgi:hypothetical protein